MKKIIPFRKELSFDSKIYEISSISLEHTLKLKEDNQISGEFIISGTYKLTEASINVDPFEYILPFSISIDKKYDTKNIDVDINDFYYELSSNQILSVNIEVVIDGLEEKEEIFVTKEKTVIPNETEDDREELETEEKIETKENIEPVAKAAAKIRTFSNIFQIFPKLFFQKRQNRLEKHRQKVNLKKKRKTPRLQPYIHSNIAAPLPKAGAKVEPFKHTTKY